MLFDILLIMRDIYFDELKTVFAKNNKKLYIVGGSSRDLLLGKEYSDHDFVTDATPSELKVFLKEADYTFAKFGSVKIRLNGQEIDVTTLREEGEYLDCRHPSYIKFIKDLETDSKRRDFTINAIYLDADYNVIDFHEGLNDLREKKIRFIGDPKKRIEEDPLRIMRAYRFAKTLGFEIEENSLRALEESKDLLNKLNPAKIIEEKKKESR